MMQCAVSASFQTNRENGENVEIDILSMPMTSKAVTTKFNVIKLVLQKQY